LLLVAASVQLHVRFAAAGPGTYFVAITIQCNRTDHDQTLDDQLPDLADIHQVQATAQHSDAALGELVDDAVDFRLVSTMADEEKWADKEKRAGQLIQLPPSTLSVWATM
jgi:hypothetical protein